MYVSVMLPTDRSFGCVVNWAVLGYMCKCVTIADMDVGWVHP